MNIRQIREAREVYSIDEWGAGYFGINDSGEIVAHPTAEEHIEAPLPEIIKEAKALGVDSPIIIRFPQVVEKQVERMCQAFRDSIWEFNFTGQHYGVFPFKVNQRREFIEHIVNAGKAFHYGLEVGSKTEFLAALSYQMSDKALLVCNGFKDEEFIEMAFIAAEMGKNVVLVVEGPDEMQMLLDRYEPGKPTPKIGLRVRLYSKGSGKWEKSSGESSKFGLTTIEVLKCLKMIEDKGCHELLAMLHFHIGSQITQIKRIKNAMKEASRVYAKVCQMGFSPEFLNIGGGVGVDYDGSKTSFQSSANYTLKEFASDAVYVIGEVCNNEQVKHPNIVTESGRVIAAYHSVVVTNIREVQAEETLESLDEDIIESIGSKNHKGIKELNYILDNMNRKNYSEYYHDAVEYHEELFTLFGLGYLDLTERAIAEDLFNKICRKAIYFSSYSGRYAQEFEHLQQQMVAKYLANFSMFQSIPDAWAIDQMFPVLPLSRHDEKPTHKASIVDITCDSDGCLDKFIDKRTIKNFIDLHSPNDDPYFLGFFLVGAYQESLANEHNLFGAINEVEVTVNEAGEWHISKTTNGDPISELLECRNFDISEMLKSYEEQIKQSSLIPSDQRSETLAALNKYMQRLPYLCDNYS